MNVHRQAYDAVARMVAELGYRDRELSVLDIGGRDINGHVRDLFTAATWTTLDHIAAPEVDIVSDAATWTPDRRYDLVVCTEVLEHTQGWREILATAAKAADTLILTCASTGRAPHSATGDAVIPPGEWYQNVPGADLDAVLGGLYERYAVDATTTPGDVYACGGHHPAISTPAIVRDNHQLLSHAACQQQQARQLEVQ